MYFIKVDFVLIRALTALSFCLQNSPLTEDKTETPSHGHSLALFYLSLVSCVHLLERTTDAHGNHARNATRFFESGLLSLGEQGITVKATSCPLAARDAGWLWGPS